MNSHRSTERSEGYLWNRRLHALPRSGRPIVLRPPDDDPAKHAIRRLAYRPEVEFPGHLTMGSPRSARLPHGGPSGFMI
jgi:hypothetical protein